jgi:hypothetical protein
MRSGEEHIHMSTTSSEKRGGGVNSNAEECTRGRESVRKQRRKGEEEHVIGSWLEQTGKFSNRTKDKLALGTETCGKTRNIDTKDPADCKPKDPMFIG